MAKISGRPRAIRTPMVLRVLAHAALWSALAFALNLTWEFGHVRLYTIWATADGMSVALALLHCSVGDVMIALALFVLAGIVLRRADWPASRPWTGGAIVMIGAVVSLIAVIEPGTIGVLEPVRRVETDIPAGSRMRGFGRVRNL